MMISQSSRIYKSPLRARRTRRFRCGLLRGWRGRVRGSPGQVGVVGRAVLGAVVEARPPGLQSLPSPVFFPLSCEFDGKIGKDAKWEAYTNSLLASIDETFFLGYYRSLCVFFFCCCLLFLYRPASQKSSHLLASLAQ